MTLFIDCAVWAVVESNTPIANLRTKALELRWALDMQGIIQIGPLSLHELVLLNVVNFKIVWECSTQVQGAILRHKWYHHFCTFRSSTRIFFLPFWQNIHGVYGLDYKVRLQSNHLVWHQWLEVVVLVVVFVDLELRSAIFQFAPEFRSSSRDSKTIIQIIEQTVFLFNNTLPNSMLTLCQAISCLRQSGLTNIFLQFFWNLFLLNLLHQQVFILSLDLHATLSSLILFHFHARLQMHWLILSSIVLQHGVLGKVSFLLLLLGWALIKQRCVRAGMTVHLIVIVVVVLVTRHALPVSRFYIPLISLIGIWVLTLAHYYLLVLIQVISILWNLHEGIVSSLASGLLLLTFHEILPISFFLFFPDLILPWGTATSRIWTQKTAEKSVFQEVFQLFVWVRARICLVSLLLARWPEAINVWRQCLFMNLEF